MIPQRHERMRAILERLTRDPTIIGATLITRDGLCVINSDAKILAPETFSAMSAALMGAAETAFYGLGGSKSLRVTAETDAAKMIALGASEELLLVVVAKTSLPLDDLIQKALAASREIAANLRGS